MELNEFQKLSEEIPTFLNEDEQEEKLIQIVDLKHFIECYNPDIKIVDCIKNKINSVELEGNKIGIVFFELKKFPQNYSFFESLPYDIQSGYKELWFVFVEEKGTSDVKQFINFIEDNELSPIFDKIFLFHFFQSVIHQLK